ncbi:NEDD8-activating enzyme E1 regulatory subunit [Daphnia magna]|uniref:NEDD8-activating enzyme E1 regulatory subunit n=1 Tax=Daphnia magna TaxID=35525 RepID=UPI001E1BBCDE|nr:NEDD8-activating enzyme E1 regulatory subunit [Daphnia magna]
MASPSPKSPGQISDKSKKYDRQLRLWGDHGQTALESANVCLINATATGTEILKSLVLPGIGSFTIVDGALVTGEDAGNNFFLDHSKIGKPRAHVATQLLMELNSDVKGDYIEETCDQLLSNNPDFFCSFSVVIATGLTEKSLHSLSSNLWQNNVPLVVSVSYGFIGSIRLQVSELCIIESHPDNLLEDLRLDKPFPGLKEFMDTIKLPEMNHKQFSHTPYLVLLYKALEIWNDRYGPNPPSNYKEKEILRNIIKNELGYGIVEEEDSNSGDEENVAEAIKAVNTALTKTQVPSNVQKILNDDQCIRLKEKNSFWIIARAVKEFVEKEGNGVLPLRGSLPDMTSDSQRYIALQNVYREQASKDAEHVWRHVQTILKERGWAGESVIENDVKLFCRHSSELRMIRGSCLAEELDGKQLPPDVDINQQLEEPDSPWLHYLLLRAVNKFHTENGSFPGYYDDNVETDIAKLKGCFSRLLNDLGCQGGSLSKDDNLHEMCRYGAAELHAVAAFIGGCAAQEVIKLITKQYVPLDNTFIFNSVTSTTATLRL